MVNHPSHSTSSNPRTGDAVNSTQRDSANLTNLIMLRGRLGHTLKVSFADVGAKDGHPVFVFLGLGAVRYLVGLYDELAAALGLRLICVDRWGLGRTDNVPTEKRSVLGWGFVITELADRLGIQHFSLLAHSAGAPYAMGTALSAPERVVGPINLLCPWTGSQSESNYRWLKYVPDGLLRTAQAAEWRLQGWRLGKSSQDPPKSPARQLSNDNSLVAEGCITAPPSNAILSEPSPAARHGKDPEPGRMSGFRASTSDAAFLTIRRQASYSHQDKASFPQAEVADMTRSRSDGRSIVPTLKKKSSFLGNFLSPKQAQSEFSGSKSDILTTEAETPPTCDDASLSHRPSLSRTTSASSAGASHRSHERFQIPATSLHESIACQDNLLLPPSSSSAAQYQNAIPSPTREHDRQYVLANVQMETESSQQRPDRDSELGLGVALLRASHAESLGGSAADLSLILGKKPWGFEFPEVMHPCRIWHGSKDERISLASSIRMERELKDCTLKIVDGAGHNLMSNSAVIVEVLEHIQCSADLWSTSQHYRRQS